MPLVKHISILVFLTVTCFQLQAQKGWELGGWLGSSFYFGDLNTSYDLSRPGLAAGLISRYNLNERLSFTGSFNYGRVRGSDEVSNNSFQRDRNLNFYSDIFDIATVVEFNFFPYIHGSYKQGFTPYIFAGANVFRYNPKKEFQGNIIDLVDYGTEGQFPGQEYNLVSFGAAYGIGVKWDINRLWSLNAFISGRRLLTDYLDDVSGEYPNYNQLKADRGDDAVEIANPSTTEGFGATNTQRGDSTKNDAYHFVGISMLRYFGKLECPKISTIKL